MKEAVPAAHDDSRPLVLLVEDEVLVRMALTRMLERSGFHVIPVSSADEAVQVLSAVPDIRAVVTDVKLSLGGMDGFELARKVRGERNIGVVVASGRAEPGQDELPPGMHFIAKPVHRTTLVHLVRDVMSRPSEVPKATSDTSVSGADPAHGAEPQWELSPRQHEVLALLVQGKSNQQIAEAMSVSEHTVKMHMAGIFRALGVASRVEAALAGMRVLAGK
jgi:DNA-binding NarL/FixJ family response regulator